MSSPSSIGGHDLSILDSSFLPDLVDGAEVELLREAVAPSFGKLRAAGLKLVASKAWIHARPFGTAAADFHDGECLLDDH